MIRRAQTRDTDSIRITFVLPPDHPHAGSSVVGDFNAWDPAANPFRRRSNQTFSTTITLRRGEAHRFRYLSENGEWFDEPEADRRQSNEHGTFDCVLET